MRAAWELLFRETVLRVRVSEERRRQFFFRADICTRGPEGKFRLLGGLNAILPAPYIGYPDKAEETKIHLDGACVATVGDTAAGKRLSITGAGEWSVQDGVETRIVAAQEGTRSLRLASINGIFRSRLDMLAKVMDDTSGEEIARFRRFPYYRPWTESELVKRLLPAATRANFFPVHPLFHSVAPLSEFPDETIKPLLAAAALRYCATSALSFCIG